ncbi:MAG: methyl-accepting chemotaxis protein, partial [Kangiellaceae bacterium]|nr:methyl-accepting chemotaxis protein [Kangiellaceae bacterium]
MKTDANSQFSIDNLKFAYKMALAFGTVIILLVVLAVEGIRALDGARSHFIDYRSMARETNISGRLQANLLEARVNALKYIRTGDASSQSNFRQRIDQLKQLIEQAGDQITDEQRLLVVKAVAADINSYDQAFEQIVAFKETRNQLVDKLNTIGPEIPNLLDQIIDGSLRSNQQTQSYKATQLKNDLLIARLHVIKFLEDNSEQSVNNFSDAFGDFEQGLATLRKSTSGTNGRQLQQIVSLAADYKTSFDQLTDTIFSRNDVIAQQLDSIGPKVAKSLEDIKLAVKQQQDILGPQIQENSYDAIVKLAVITIVIILLSILITILFS